MNEDGDRGGSDLCEYVLQVGYDEWAREIGSNDVVRTRDHVDNLFVSECPSDE